MPKIIDSALKARIAIEALQGAKTVSEIASQYRVAPNFVTRMKTEAIEKMATLFNQGNHSRVKELEEEQESLLKLIGEKERDIEWLKKKCKQLGIL